MRKWHRWIASIAGVFLVFVASTGILLHLDMIVRGFIPEVGTPPPPKTTVASLDQAAIGAAVTRAVAKARAQRPDLPVDYIGLSLKDGGTISVGATGREIDTIKFDARTGQIKIPARKPGNYHYILQDLHAGYYFGWPGRVMSMLLGASLLVLAFTGLKLWFDMYARRRDAGRKDFFWER